MKPFRLFLLGAFFIAAMAPTALLHAASSQVKREQLKPKATIQKPTLQPQRQPGVVKPSAKPGEYSPIVRGGIRGHEASEKNPKGGHVIKEHVGKTKEQLKDRLKQNSNLSKSGSFKNEADAQKYVGLTIENNKENIRHWLERETIPKKPFFSSYKTTTGQYLKSIEGEIVDAKGVTIVLKRDAASKDGYSLLTAYPDDE